MNFDTGHPAFGTRLPADGGDIPVREDEPEANRRLIRDAVAEVLEAGAVPVLLGGDDSLPIPMLQALEGQGPLTILQIDAHIDWRREVEGERWGLSSTMRRASEMAHVERIIQVGQRGMGSALPRDFEDARHWGVHFVPASRPDPVEEALAHVPEGANLALCLDWDALDPSVMPAVIGRTAGGLTFLDALRLIDRAHRKARIRAIDFVEFMPRRDVDGLGATLAAQLVAAAMGLLSRP
jgi:agmatinase